MRVMLIGPSLFRAEDLTYITPPLGLLHIGAALREEGAEVDVFDPNLRTEDELEKILDEKEFDMVGIGSLWDSIEADAKISNIVREQQPSTLIVMGSYSATFTPQMLFDMSSADILIAGEGEKPMKRLYEHLSETHYPHPLLDGDAILLDDIEGAMIKYLDIKHKGEWRIQTNAGNTPLTEEELNSLPNPAFDLIDYRDYWNRLKKHGSISDRELYTIRIMATRGCRGSCVFCCSTRFFDKARNPHQEGCPKKQKPYIRYTAPKKVADTIEEACRTYPETETIFFNDDNFNEDKEYTKKLCEEIIGRKKHGRIPHRLSFTCFGRIDNADRETLRWMKHAGFRLICYGIESGSDHVLKTIGKKFNMKQVREGLKETQKAGIDAYAWIIALTMKGTADDVMQTIEFATECLTQNINIGLYLSLVPFPGAPITKAAERKGLIRYDTKENIEAEEGDGRGMMRKGIAILPEDPILQQVYHDTNDLFEKSKEEFMERHKITHLPRKTLTYVWLHAMIEAMKKNIPTEEITLNKLKQRLLETEKCL